VAIASLTLLFEAGNHVTVNLLFHH